MIGKTLGHYEILEPLGAGGMGEVYRAHDVTLKRDVAIKVLPEVLADDPERLARLEREAHLLAALNHTNIATIHSLEEADGTRFLVMELVKGESLEQLIAKGPLPVEKALGICAQIARALEAAHAEGIIHRDLKPANVLITPDGHAKVLDFGLAKATAADSTDAELSRSPTVTVAGTRTGVILGTAPYMSPEQVRGKQLDKRTDIWAFGCLLYEAVTGKRTFDRETVADTLAAVLDAEPDWETLPAVTPAIIVALLHRCLRKDPDRRLHDIADARIEIEEVGELGVEPGVVMAGAGIASPASSWAGTTRAVAVAIAVIAMATGSLATWSLMRPTLGGPQPSLRFEVELPAGVNFTNTGRHAVAISPGGTHLVFSANDQLFVRPLNDLVSVPLPGTEGGGRSPFFSPDGQWVGFWAEGRFSKVPISGGFAVKLCDAPYPFGASWGADQILYGAGSEGIWRVSADGGEPEQLIVVGSGEQAHSPQLLPGGDWVLFTLRSGGQVWDETQIVIQSLATQERKPLLIGKDARYLANGYLLYASGGALLARPFDVSRLEVTGGAVSVVDGVMDAGPYNTGAAHFSASLEGTLVYIPAGPQDRALVWVDRAGVGERVTDELRQYGYPRISPDGKRVAVSIRTDAPNREDVWILEIDQSILTRLTAERTRTWNPVWTQDGVRVAFSFDSNGTADLYWQHADFSDQEAEQLFDADRNIYPAGWTKDDKTLVVFDDDISLLRFDERGKPDELLPFVATESYEASPALSPDGRWLAYVSDLSGEVEVYVKPFPGPGGQRVQISNEGGREPVWGPDGREVFYRVEDKMVAVAVNTEPSFAVVARKVLFERAFRGSGSGAFYDIHPDGQRFLMVEELDTWESRQRINVVLNWFEELKRLVPTDGSQ